MSSFINSLIDRSTSAATSIQPRLRGKFERAAAPSETFSSNDEFTSSTEGSVQPATSQRTERTRITKLIEERSEEIPKAQKAQRENKDQSTPGAKLQGPPRFEPSYKLLAPKLSSQQQSIENSSHVTNVHHHSKLLSTENATSADIENKQQQVTSHHPDASATPTTTTKEVYKSLPVVQPNANNALRVESSDKTQPKQSPVASSLRKQSPSRTINISIGRIEVRISQPPAPQPASPKKESVAMMGLDEYLQKRNQQSK